MIAGFERLQLAPLCVLEEGLLCTGGLADALSLARCPRRCPALVWPLVVLAQTVQIGRCPVRTEPGLPDPHPVFSVRQKGARAAAPHDLLPVRVNGCALYATGGLRGCDRCCGGFGVFCSDNAGWPVAAIAG